MPIFLDGEIQEVWNSYRNGSAEDFYQTQFNSLLQSCSNKDVLPFFDLEKKEPPKNIMNQNTMRDINKTTAELHAASIGAKGNNYIFGTEANELGLKLDYKNKKKDMTPLLISAMGKYNNSRQVLLDEMNVAADGASCKHQFMYNIEQFDERSQKRLIEITKDERAKESEKLKNRKEDARKYYKQNRQGEKSQDAKRLLEENSKASDQFRLAMIGNSILVHNIAQAHGSHDMIGKAHVLPENIEKKKRICANEINTIRKAMEEGKAPKDALMQVIFKGQETAEKMYSKDLGYVQKHEKFEEVKKKENLRNLNRGYER